MSTTIDIPGYRAGTWDIDPAHSTVGFTVRHLMISKVRGTFEEFSGTIVTGENPLDSSVTATAKVSSVNTREPNRDGHLRTGDFFSADEFPDLTFVSTGVRAVGSDFEIDGDLTIRGVTRPTTFSLEFGGFMTDPFGNYKAGATAEAVVNREDFGLNYNSTLETGGVLLGEKVTITLELQATLQS